MIRFVLKRLGQGVLVIWGIVTLLFVIFNLIGDPAEMMKGQRSDVATEEAIKAKYHLDEPLHIQYLLYLNDLSPVSFYGAEDSSYVETASWSVFGGPGSGAFVLKMPYMRRSFQSDRPVGTMLLERLPGTAILAFASILLAAVLGIFLGTIAALKRDTWIDRSILSVTLLGISAPSFFVAIFLVWIFSVLLGEFTGLNVTGFIFEPNVINSGYTLHLENLILPALALGIRPLAIITQLTRSSMLDSVSRDFVRTARAKGLEEGVVNRKHALRNALNPVITSISGWFASLLAGAFFIEYVFNWHGIGKLTIDALGTNDYPVILGSAIFIGTVFVLVNIVVDILYARLDPRVKLS